MRLNRNGKGCSARPRGSSANKKKAQRKTGGGSALGEPSDTSKLIMEVYDNTPDFSGIMEGLSPVSTTVTITLHEGTPTITENLWKKFFFSILSHVTK